MKKHKLRNIIGYISFASIALGISSCSDENDIINSNGLLDMSHYATVFSVSPESGASAMQGLFSDEIANVPRKISTDINYKWWWTYGDQIWAEKDGVFKQSDGSNIPNSETLTHNAMFGFKEYFSAPTVNVRYTGNGGDNGNTADQVIISAEQTQESEGSSVHIGKYGDCATATAERKDDGNYDFELDHRASYLLFSPRLDVENGMTTYTKKKSDDADNNTPYGQAMPIKSITVTKTNTDGSVKTICGTYPFSQSGLDIANVQNGGQSIKLNCPKDARRGILSAIGDERDQNKTYYMVIQPGQHDLQIDYELEYPELTFNYTLGSKEATNSTTYSIDWSPKVFTRTIANNYSFSENGFSKISHKLSIPAYREAFTYYAWGASAHYFAGKDVYTTTNKEGYEIKDDGRAFDAPKTTRDNYNLNPESESNIFHQGANNLPIYENGERVGSTSKSYPPYQNLKHYYDSYNDKFFDKYFIDKALPSSNWGDKYVQYLRYFGPEPVGYHLAAHLPLWPVRGSSSITFYKYDGNANNGEGGIVWDGANKVEPDFLSPTLNSQKSWPIATTTLDEEKKIYEYTKHPENTGTYVFNLTKTYQAGDKVAVEHNNRDFRFEYRSITRMPNANEITWYLKYGDIHYDYSTYWLAKDKSIDGMFPLVRGGIWIKKKEYISGFSAEQDVNGNDLRTTSMANDNGFRVYRNDFTGSVPSGAAKTAKIGVPAEKDKYFFLPLLGYYHTFASPTDQDNTNVELRLYGQYGFYWTRTPWPGGTSSDYNNALHAERQAYYLKITPEYVSLSWDMYENRKHGFVGNERPNWQRYMPEGNRKIADNMQNDLWFQ